MERRSLPTSLSSPALRKHLLASADGQESPIVEIIDHEGSFGRDTGALLDAVQLQPCAGDYRIVSVFGAQSSGKSTLLNLLFDTAFPTMDPRSSRGRYQTTRGVWLAKAPYSPTLVLDCEGTDSKERGEAHGSVERRLTLFALALSDVVIVNMWSHDIGRFEAANYAIIKCVFEIYLQLFQQTDSPRTLLLFALRDHVDQTDASLDKLADILKADIEQLWSEMSKPEGRWANVTDFFDFSFVALPHKTLQAEEFGVDVMKLRERFTNAGTKDYVFKENYSRNIPIDGLARYAENIWLTIAENRDLDLPSQREMLALYRCGEVLEAVVADFEDLVAPVRSQIEHDEAVVPCLGQELNMIVGSLLERFDQICSRYAAAVYAEKRDELVAKLAAEAFSLYNTHLLVLKADCLSQFEEFVREAAHPCADWLSGTESTEAVMSVFSTPLTAGGNLPSSSKDGPDHRIATVMWPGEGLSDALADECVLRLERFNESAAASELPGQDWSSASIFRSLKTALQDRAAAARVVALSGALTVVRQVAVSSFSTGLHELLGGSDEGGQRDLWEEASAWAHWVLSVAHELRMSMISGVGGPSASDDRHTKHSDELFAELCSTAVHATAAASGVGALRAKRVFERNFKYDAKGHLHVPGRDEDLDVRFEVAMAAAGSVVDSFAAVQLAGSNVLGVEAFRKEVASAGERARMRRSVARDAEEYMLEARLHQESLRLQRHGVPLPFWVLLILLGWNEMVAVVRRPLLLVLLVAAGAAVYVFKDAAASGYAAASAAARSALVAAIRSRRKGKPKK